MSTSDPHPNLYYSPEAFGLEPVVEIDYSDGEYQFDLRVIWRHKESGKLYTARDSGCSCPSPFESYDSVEKLTSFNAPELIEEARSEAQSEDYRGGPVTDFIEKIKALVFG